MGYCLGDPTNTYNSNIKRIFINSDVDAEDIYIVYDKNKIPCFIGSDIDIGDIYTIYDENEIPCLEVVVHFNNWNPLQAIYIFQEFLCIGLGEKVYFIFIKTGELREHRVSLYFGYFYEYKNRLYVASGERLYCFDSGCNLVWVSKPIAVDGILFHAFEGNKAFVSCEMDPPGKWIERCICLKDGRECSF